MFWEKDENKQKEAQFGPFSKTGQKVFFLKNLKLVFYRIQKYEKMQKWMITDCRISEDSKQLFSTVDEL